MSEQKHWMVGQQSFVDTDMKSYRVAPEPYITEAFLDAKIKEIQIWKNFIPLYYQAITRTPRSRMQFMPRFYDPLIDVSNDHVNITMRAKDNRQYWNLLLYEDVFKDASFDKGQCFVDFNINFIEQIRRLKSKDVSYLLIDETGLEYASNVDTSFLPHEDRGSLIKLLKQVQSDFDEDPDEELTFNTADAYNHGRIKGFGDGPLFDQRLPGGQTKLVPNPKGGRRIRTTMDEWGEVYNPFYILRSSKSSYQTSRLRHHLGEVSKVKYWEDSDEYLIEMPLTSRNGTEVGKMRLFAPGRDSIAPTLRDPNQDMNRFEKVEIPSTSIQKKFEIVGSKGNIYTVSHLTHSDKTTEWICECPHYLIRLKGDKRACKHIIRAQLRSK